MSGKRPVTILTGFLGSGKTTLLGRLLQDPALANTAVLVNEIGEVGLDHHLLERVDETTLLLEDGCVCCARREELASALHALLARESRGEISPVERVVVETSGLADPSRIPFTILDDPVLRHHYAPGGVLATADAVNGAAQLEESPEAVRQAAASDSILLTKTDLVGEQSIEDLTRRLRALNPAARIARTSTAEPAPEASILAGELFGQRPQAPPENSGEDRDEELSPEHVAESGIHTVSLTLDEPLEWTGFGVWLSALLYARGEDVLRVKGLLDAGGPGPVSINGVRHVIHPPEHLESWPDGERVSRLTFITRGIAPEELLASLRAFQRSASYRSAT